MKRPKGSASAINQGMEIFVPIKGILDISAEISRLNKELEKVNEAITFLDRKLLNEDFISNAPSQIVEKEKKRYSESIDKRDKINDQIGRLQALESGSD